MALDFPPRTATQILLFLLSHAVAGCADLDGQDLQGSDDPLVLDGANVASAASSPRVAIKQGKLVGKIGGQTRVFLNIPYAKPPLGALRFAPAQPAAGWTGTRQAVEFGPSCPQPPSPLMEPGPRSEDCLSLNVYAPASGKKLPVMVYIPGGAFVIGGSGAYDVHGLSEEANAIVVTLNYRLGALGLLSHPALDVERGSQPSGNDAIGDQQLALGWIKANIGEFGGDPANITLMGVSAGSLSTCLHMVSPRSRALARRFVMESGSCTGGLPLNTKAQAHAIGAELAETFCAGASDVMACLRSQAPDQLVAWGAERGITGAGWMPVVNPADPILPAHPTLLIASGNYNKGPIILGSNAREWGLFQSVGQAPTVPSVAALNTVIEQTFGPIAQYVQGQYATNMATDATANDTYVQLMTDFLIRCPVRALARLTSAQGTRVYLYHFEEGLAYHVFEVPYVLNLPNEMFGAPVLVEPLRTVVQNGLSNFARYGTPNTQAQPHWPAYTIAGDRHTVLKAAPTIGSGLSKANCDFWDQVALLAQVFM